MSNGLCPRCKTRLTEISENQKFTNTAEHKSASPPKKSTLVKKRPTDTPLPRRIRDSLYECRELDDPVKHWLAILRWNLILLPLVSTFIVLFLNISSGGAWTSLLSIIPIFVSVLVCLLGWHAMSSFRRSRSNQSVFFLRAFRQDDHSMKLRSLVRAALPEGYSLEGIRQPRKRHSALVRFFAQGWEALQLAGSEHFILEAGDRNWLARLLASAVNARGFIIDARDLTAHVGNEIHLAILLGGSERCFFLFPDSIETEAHLVKLSKTSGVNYGVLETIPIILVPTSIKDHKSNLGFVRECRSRFKAIQNRNRIEPHRQIMAYDFVRNLTPEKSWATPWFETQEARSWVALGVVGGVFWLIGSSLGQPAFMIQTWLAIIMAAAYFAAMIRF